MPTLLPVHFGSTLLYHHPASPNNPLHAKLPPMEARILNQSEEHLWSDFVATHPLGNIHQTSEWGHFQEKVPGRGKYWIIVLEENSQILAGTLLLRQSLPRGYSWLYAPRGPLLNYENHAAAHEQMAILMNEIKKIAKAEKSVFLRVDPLIPISAQLPFPHFRQNLHGFQPDHTLLLDLTRSEAEILAQMKPKGRYNIKLAEKHGVSIRRIDSSSADAKAPCRAGPLGHSLLLGCAADFHPALASFYKILSETTSRDGFHGHDQKFYENMLTTIAAPVTTNGPHSTLYLAEFEGTTLAASLNTFYRDTATYYYGASSNQDRNVMAPYLLHWKAILDAKAANYKTYDFFGIAPENAVNHPWAGVTEFKKKFGGTEVSYQLPQEFPFKKSLYILYRTYKRFC